VIVGQYVADVSDIQQFRNTYGLGPAKIKLVSDGTKPGDDPGDLVEADLDLEWAGAIAPNATLIYMYGDDANNSAFYAIDQNLAPIISESFGLCEAAVQPSGPPNMKLKRKKGTRWGSRGSLPAAILVRQPAIPAVRSHQRMGWR
jgi:hypothetical protein